MVIASHLAVQVSIGVIAVCMLGMENGGCRRTAVADDEKPPLYCNQRHGRVYGVGALYDKWGGRLFIDNDHQALLMAVWPSDKPVAADYVTCRDDNSVLLMANTEYELELQQGPQSLALVVENRLLGTCGLEGVDINAIRANCNVAGVPVVCSFRRALGYSLSAQQIESCQVVLDQLDSLCAAANAER